MKIRLIKAPKSHAHLSADFLKLAVQDFETVLQHKDCALADVWTEHIARALHKTEQRRKDLPTVVPLSMRSSNCTNPPSANNRTSVTLFIWQQWNDGKFRKKYLSDEEANELLTRLASARTERTAKSQIQ